MGCNYKNISQTMRGAFSLMELLVAMAMMALLATISAPTIAQTMQSSRLSSDGQKLIDHLNLAKQMALTRNLPVEVRFYKLPQYTEPATAAPSVYRAMQLFLVSDSDIKPITKLLLFSVPVVCSPDVNLSTFLDSSIIEELTPDADACNIPVYGKNYAYRSLVFRPNGSTTLSSSANVFLTLVLGTGKSINQGANFLTVQIDPATGRPHVFRP